MAIQLPVIVLLLISSISGCVWSESSRKELRTKELKEDQILQLGRRGQSNSVDPSRVIQLSWRPRLFLYKGFVGEEDCDRLISGDDEVVARFEEKLSAWTFLPKETGTPLQVLHFKREDEKQKYSYFGNISSLQLNEPIMATVILYLSNVSQGGQILFPKSEDIALSDCTKSSKFLRPTKGDAILFFNLHLNSTPDNASSHARCPILEGEMWCATKVFLLNVNSEKDLLQSSDTDCTDEDEKCPRWAAIGECQRNLVFMIGSPDYYGTCRKSCNAC